MIEGQTISVKGKAQTSKRVTAVVAAVAHGTDIYMVSVSLETLQITIKRALTSSTAGLAAAAVCANLRLSLTAFVDFWVARDPRRVVPVGGCAKQLAPALPGASA